MITIPIRGMIGWDVTPEGIQEALAAANGADVTFEVASGGGFIAPGLDIFNQVRNYPGHTTMHIMGYAMSMASYIPLAANEIVAEENAIYMIHNAGGGVYGDHKEILSYGAYLKGLSGVIAARYVKRTGKPLDEITQMMDDETFFFGEEMVTNGFADSIIENEEDEDEGAVKAMAQAAFKDIEARMSADPAAVRADYARASAMLKVPTIPAVAGKPKEKEQQMDLKELLSANPAAKAEHDSALAIAETVGQDVMAATVKKVSPFLASKEYPAIIGTTALNVLTGEANMIELTAAVAAVDAVREDQKSKLASDVAGEDTPGELGTPAARKDGEPASTQADLDADIAAFKGGE